MDYPRTRQYWTYLVYLIYKCYKVYVEHNKLTLVMELLYTIIVYAVAVR